MATTVAQVSRIILDARLPVRVKLQARHGYGTQLLGILAADTPTAKDEFFTSSKGVPKVRCRHSVVTGDNSGCSSDEVRCRLPMLSQESPRVLPDSGRARDINGGITGMATQCSRRSWLVNATAAVSYTVSRQAFAETPVSWLSATKIHCQTASFRDRVGVGVVLTAMAASPDGQTLAAAGDDRRIRIIRTAELNTSQQLNGHRDRIRALAFDHTGDILASVGNDGQATLYDAKNGYEIIGQYDGRSAVAGVSFAPDDSTFSFVGFTGRLVVIDPTRKDRMEIDCQCRDLRAVAYRDDDRMLAVGGQGGKLLLLDPRSGQTLGSAVLHRGPIRSLCFHGQSNTLVTIGDDGTAVVFDTENQRLLRRIQVTSGKLFSVAVLNNQFVAVAGSDNRVRILNTEEGTVVRDLEGHIGSVASLASVNGSLFSAGFDATLRRWSMSPETQSERIADSDPTKDR